MLSASPPMIVRSSLEEMLYSLRRQNEDEKPKDLPPALPTRPISKGRLPPARRSLPHNFKTFKVDSKDYVDELSVKEETKRKEKDMGFKRNSFVTKKMKKDQNEETPYAAMPEEIVIDYMNGSEQAASTSPSSASPITIPDSDVNDNVGYFIKKRLCVWCRTPSGQWELGIIQSTSGDEALVSLSHGKVVKVSTVELFPANPDILDDADDLIKLSYLNEPSVLYNLRCRYSKDMIYSKAGPILIAVNPLKNVSIYGDDFVRAYKQKLRESPHVYAIADAAYNKMLRDEVNQSIIISGESGAGKTETAKIAMQYLAVVGGGSCGIEHEIFRTNYILEAFGNAKTSQNDNSSRFGKLIEIHFSTLGKICGASIQTFLLEKSRVVKLAIGERSYHIFYQLCAGAPKNLKEKLHLREAGEYKYLNQGDCIEIDGVNDAQMFSNLMEALETLRICKEDQEQVFAILSAILWLGNISLQVVDSENHVEVMADEALSYASELMGCSSQDLILALSFCKIQAGANSTAKRLTLQQAMDIRDALVKFVYASLFDWLVVQMNKSLEVCKRHTGRLINVLDIFGFESFQRNSFEQMCINYANERLQQHFNRHLIKLEQEDYELDGIDWTKVDFEDNQDCLNLFEKKPLGLLSLLDEESNFPMATDMTFSNKLKQHLSYSPYFNGEKSGAFSVCHYAGEVLYDTDGFLEKNRDPFPSDSIQLLSSCSNELLKLFASYVLNQSQKPVARASQIGALNFWKQRVGTTFKGRLFKLMHQLESTTPHFIRCIKPNSKKLPGIYEAELVSEQIRSSGVLEVVRISKSGYPTRVKHQEFAARYGFLLPGRSARQDPLSVSIAVLQHFNVLPEMYQIGYTKLYLRTGQISVIEDKRKQVLQGILGVQKHFRGCRARRPFHEIKKGVMILQSYVRGENTRRKYNVRATFCIPNAHFTLSVSETEDSKQKPVRNSSESKQDQAQALPPAVAELQLRVLKAALEQKEEENAALHEHVQQLETRWSEYEAKMKLMEEMWQKQMASLQMSLAAARKSLVVEKALGQPGRHDVTSPCSYDSEDATSLGSHTPGASTPLKTYGINDIGVARDTNSNLYAVSDLVKEFDQRRLTFDNDVRTIVEVKQGQSVTNMNPDEELRKLKLQFESWKKGYRMRLRETKAKLHKLGHSEAHNNRRKWWEKISSRVP